MMVIGGMVLGFYHRYAFRLLQVSTSSRRAIPPWSINHLDTVTLEQNTVPVFRYSADRQQTTVQIRHVEDFSEVYLYRFSGSGDTSDTSAAETPDGVSFPLVIDTCKLAFRRQSCGTRCHCPPSKHNQKHRRLFCLRLCRVFLGGLFVPGSLATISNHLSVPLPAVTFEVARFLTEIADFFSARFLCLECLFLRRQLIAHDCDTHTSTSIEPTPWRYHRPAEPLKPMPENDRILACCAGLW